MWLVTLSPYCSLCLSDSVLEFLSLPRSPTYPLLPSLFSSSLKKSEVALAETYLHSVQTDYPITLNRLERTQVRFTYFKQKVAHTKGDSHKREIKAQGLTLQNLASCYDLQELCLCRAVCKLFATETSLLVVYLWSTFALLTFCLSIFNCLIMYSLLITVY